MPDEERSSMFGTVTRYYDNKGYGFIRGEDGNTYFIHASNLYGEQIARGYYVHFNILNVSPNLQAFARYIIYHYIYIVYYK